MRWDGRIGTALLAGTLAGPGCFLFEKKERDAVRQSVASRLPASVDRVVIDFRLVDQPAGDPFANDQLWMLARCPLTHEKAALLAENGIRVGIISGIVPSEFIDRVTSEGNLIDPRAFATGVGEEKVIPVNGPLERAEARVVRDWNGTSETWNRNELECGLGIRAMPASAGRTRFACSPLCQSGDKQAWLKSTADRTNLVWERAKTKDDLMMLVWEVTLGPGEYLIVGPTDRPGGTLGELFFFAAEPARLRQRFLVVRGRADAATPKPLATVAGHASEASGQVDDLAAIPGDDRPPRFGP